MNKRRAAHVTKEVPDIKFVNISMKMASEFRVKIMNFDLQDQDISIDLDLLHDLDRFVDLLKFILIIDQRSQVLEINFPWYFIVKPETFFRRGHGEVERPSERRGEDVVHGQDEACRAGFTQKDAIGVSRWS